MSTTLSIQRLDDGRICVTIHSDGDADHTAFTTSAELRQMLGKIESEEYLSSIDTDPPG